MSDTEARGLSSLQHEVRQFEFQIKLYNFPFGPYPRRVRIYLAEKGVTSAVMALISDITPREPARKRP